MNQESEFWFLNVSLMRYKKRTIGLVVYENVRRGHAHREK